MGAGVARFLHPYLVFARALHCRKKHSSPPDMQDPLVPQGFGHLLASSFQLGVSGLLT